MPPVPCQAIAANFFAAYSWFHATYAALTLHPSGALTCLYAPGGLVDFNLALPSPGHWPDPATVLDTTDVEADGQNGQKEHPLRTDLNAASAFFAARHSAWSCWFPPGEKRFPEAQQLGFSGATDHMGQYLALADLLLPAPTSPCQLDVRRVTQPAELNAFAELIAEGWNLDPTPYRRFFSAMAPHLLQPTCPKQWYIGWINERPACCMECFVQPDQGVVGVYYVATHHAFRRQGHALHMQAAVLSGARDQGYSAAVVLSAPGEQRLLTRLGFADQGLWREYWTN